MMNTQEDQTKNRDLWQFQFQQKASSSHLIDVQLPVTTLDKWLSF